jgi:glycosyltransferase involved in cell wall biosynthesis
MRGNNYRRRIGIDARFILRPLRGIPLYVTRLCEHLPALNPDYLFYLFINKGFEHNDLPENYQPRIDNIRKHDNVRIVNFDDDAEIMWEQIYLPRLVRAHKIDLLHMPANRMCFFTPVPTVVTVHDVIEYLFLPIRYSLRSILKSSNIRLSFYLLRTRSYIWTMYRYALKNASKIITVSNYSAGDIVRRLNINHDKIRVIYHGLDEEFLRPGKNGVSNSTQRSFVLMLGGDSYQKNPEGAISAWANVSEEIRRKYPLTIIGFCGNEQSPLIKALKRYNLLNEVEIKGWVSKEELIQYFQNATLFLYLSRYEGFGFPLLQAMGSGIPVISTNRSSIPEVLGDVGLQYDPDDHKGIAEGIEKMLSNKSLRDKQSIIEKERASLFSWQRSAEEHLKVYEEGLKNV